MRTEILEQPAAAQNRRQSADVQGVKAWVARAAKGPIVMETLDVGPLAAEEVEVAVDHCGLCHSDLSVLNNDWGISRFPAVLGHEVVGRVTAVGPATKGLSVGQRVGVGWYSGSDMHCRQCMSGNHHLCPNAQATILATAAGSRRTSARTARGPFPCRRVYAPPTPGRCCAAASPCLARWRCTRNPPTASA